MLLLLMTVACGEKDTGDSAAPVADDWASVNTILENSCAFSGCHGGGESGLTLAVDASEANYAEIVEVESEDNPSQILVVPGDHAGSYLWRKCAAEEGILGDPMPTPGPGLDEPRLAIIAAWIDAGALQ